MITDEKELKNDQEKGYPFASPDSEEPCTGIWRTSMPIIDMKKCIKCRTCWLSCPDAAVKWDNGPKIDYNICKGCMICWKVCPAKAITRRDNNESKKF